MEEILLRLLKKKKKKKNIHILTSVNGRRRRDFGNEEEIGLVFKNTKVPRSEYIVTSKL